MKGAIVRLTVEYPRDWEALIDEAALREAASQAFEFHLVKRPQIKSRIRLPEGKVAGSMTAEELLDHYWKTEHSESADPQALMNLARQIIQKAEGGED